jgi:hypothetical protein
MTASLRSAGLLKGDPRETPSLFSNPAMRLIERRAFPPLDEGAPGIPADECSWAR